MKRFNALFLMFSLFVLIGCTSKNYSSIETDFISFLPSGADIYLRYPVQQNLKLSQEILTIFAPTMSKKNVNQLLKRLDTLYISIKGHQINAIASGSFPSFALGIIFKEKNGWKKIKDDSIPITKKYYSSVESNFQIAFPNQSVVLISKNVTDLLKNYEKSYFNPPDFTEQDLFPFSKSNISGVIDFSFPNFTNLLQAEIKGFNFKLPIKSTSGYLKYISEADDNLTYLLDGYVDLVDFRASKAAIAALKIAFRTLKLNFEIELQDNDMEKIIHVAGPFYPIDFINKMVVDNNL